MLFKYCHEILAFTGLAEADLVCIRCSADPWKKWFFFQRCQSSFIPVACSYFFTVVMRGIPYNTQDYKSKDPWFKSTYSRKLNVLALHNAVLCQPYHFHPKALKQPVSLALREKFKTEILKAQSTFQQPIYILYIHI